MCKPLKLVTQKSLRSIAPPNISPLGSFYLEIALKYKIKQRKTVNFLPRIRFLNANFPYIGLSEYKPLQR